MYVSYMNHFTALQTSHVITDVETLFLDWVDMCVLKEMSIQHLYSFLMELSCVNLTGETKM